jgi:RHS repeat-associated protein
LTFAYNASGQRIKKKVTVSSTVTTTWYIRDASGNIMSIYKEASEALTWESAPIYGISRVGSYESGIELGQIGGGSGPGILTSCYRGKVVYEITNHLGNVLATITDRKIGKTTSVGNWTYFVVDYQSFTDYYAFGMQMKERSFNSGSYAFGYNGMEKDDDVKGDGNSLDFGARIYDSRLGRWLSLDPLENKYPNLSQYCFVNNNPVLFVDLDGMSFDNPYTYWKKKFQKIVEDDKQILENVYSRYGNDVEKLRKRDFKKTRKGRKDKTWKHEYDSYKDHVELYFRNKTMLTMITEKESAVNTRLTELKNQCPKVYKYFNEYEINTTPVDILLMIDFVDYSQYSTLGHWGQTFIGQEPGPVVGASAKDADLGLPIQGENAIPVEIAVVRNIPADKYNYVTPPLKTLLHELGHFLAATLFKSKVDEYYKRPGSNPKDQGHGNGNPSGNVADQFEKKYDTERNFDPSIIKPK